MKLFHAASKINTPIKLRGDTHAVLHSAYQREMGNPEHPIYGEIFHFLKLDPEADWFNLNDGEEATPTDLDEISIPNYLQPHLKRIRYTFFPKSHILVFASVNQEHRLSPDAAKNFFQQLLSEISLLHKFRIDEVNITAIPDQTPIREAFNSYSVQKLVMVINRPNPDGTDDFDEAFEESLLNEGVGKYREEKTAAKGQQIRPNSETDAKIKIAQRDGHVHLTAKDHEDNRVEIDSREKPLKHPVTYDSSLSFGEFFIGASINLLSKILSDK